MKMIIRPMYLALFLTLTFLSCNNEELLEEPLSEVIVEEPTPEDTSTGTSGNEPSTTPCDFKLDTVQANSTVIINCVMDLGGQTVNLPANVTIVYEGGDIINGTLNFSNGNVISGELLNSSLTMDGSKPQIKDPTFNFDPKRWGIVEGKVSDSVALKNRQILNSIMQQIKSMGITSFQIDKMDAYFYVNDYTTDYKKTFENAIQIPSNFELKMGKDTFVRVQPNNAPSYNLISIYKSDNIKITGGNLVGDRWEHDYSYTDNYKSHEWGHVLQISGGKNILIDGINISNAAGDGFGVHGSTIRNSDGTVGNGEYISQNVTLKNSSISASRRNGLSLLDGNGILIENCDIKDTAKGENTSGVSYSSAGVWPKFGVSLEAWRTVNEDGSLNEYERIQNVVFKGNNFTGNKGGDIVVFTCSNITIEDNFFDSFIGNKAANDIIIKNNTFIGRMEDGHPYEYAILLNSMLDGKGKELNYNYTISGNKIENYNNAMILSGESYKVFNNLLSNFKSGIGLGELINCEFYNNNLNSVVKDGFGYYTRGNNLKSVSIKNEYVNVTRRPIDFYNIISSGNNLTFDSCEFTSTGKVESLMENCKNISYSNCTINTNFEVVNSTNIIFNGQSLSN